MPSFLCSLCKKSFLITPETLQKFPSWQPRTCFACKKNRVSREENLSRSEVLEKYTQGPQTGVFTDGSANPNPGPGGWGAVYAVDGMIKGEEHGHEPCTTNNRMELMGLLAAFRLVPLGQRAIIYSDSELCVKTFTLWVNTWKARGWRRSGTGAKGEIKNLALVQEVHEIFLQRPELSLVWIKAHAGNRWNEYADALANAYKRSEA